MQDTGSEQELYSDTPQSPSQPAEQRDEEYSPETALLPESLCPGMKPGDKIELRIVSVEDGQYQVAYEKEDEQQEEEMRPAPAAPPGGMDELMA